MSSRSDDSDDFDDARERESGGGDFIVRTISMPFFLLLLLPEPARDRADEVDGTKDEEHQRDDEDDGDDDDRNGLPPSSRGLVELAAATANIFASRI